MKSYNIPEFLQYINLDTPEYEDIWIANFDDFKKIRLKSKPIQIEFYVFSLEYDVDSNIKLNFNDVDREDCYIYYDKPGGVLEWDLNYLCKGYFFLLSKNLFERYTEKNSFTNFHNQKVFLKDSEKSLLLEFFRKAHDEFIKKDFSREILNSYASVLLAHIHSFYKRYSKERKIKDNQVVRKFNNLLVGYFDQENEFTPLPSVSYFAESVCLSPNHFSNIIKKNTGKSPVKHIHNYMLLKAKRDLKSSNDSIRDIGNKLGFEYQTYFTRFFKKKTGLTPTQFRNQ